MLYINGIYRGALTFEIIDMAGRSMRSGNLLGQRIPALDLSAGTYILKLATSSNSRSTPFQVK